MQQYDLDLLLFGTIKQLLLYFFQLLSHLRKFDQAHTELKHFLALLLLNTIRLLLTGLYRHLSPNYKNTQLYFELQHTLNLPL
jgi:hypothetical protein